MNRTDAVSYIGARFAKYLTAASRTAADTTGNLAEIIDDAFRALGVLPGDLATAETTDVEGDVDLIVQLPYRTLEQVCRDIGVTYFDVTVGDSFKLSQISGACRKDLEEAKAAVLERFGTVGVVDGEGAGEGISTIDLNYLADEVLA
ncbi:MAG: hypothetical protein AB7R89_13670 [Dehalococcoidia bacterium]